MAASLPTKGITIPGTKWSFSLNPGPFNVKEHVLITILANAGSSSVYAVGIITIVKAFYHTEIHPLAALLLTQSTQVNFYEYYFQNLAKINTTKRNFQHNTHISPITGQGFESQQPQRQSFNSNMDWTPCGYCALIPVT